MRADDFLREIVNNTGNAVLGAKNRVKQLDIRKKREEINAERAQVRDKQQKLRDALKADK